MSDVTPPPKKRPREQQNGKQDTQKRNAHIAQCQVGEEISVSRSPFPYFFFWGGHEKEEEEKWGTDGRWREFFPLYKTGQITIGKEEKNLFNWQISLSQNRILLGQQWKTRNEGRAIKHGPLSKTHTLSCVVREESRHREKKGGSQVTARARERERRRDSM